jgi:hypothetical protein
MIEQLEGRLVKHLPGIAALRAAKKEMAQEMYELEKELATAHAADVQQQQKMFKELAELVKRAAVRNAHHVPATGELPKYIESFCTAPQNDLRYFGNSPVAGTQHSFLTAARFTSSASSLNATLSGSMSTELEQKLMGFFAPKTS